MASRRQVPLHELVTVLCAPTVALSAPDGQFLGTGVQGVYQHDRRAISRLEFAIEDADLVATGSRTDTTQAEFHGCLRLKEAPQCDPTLRYVRKRSVWAGGVRDVWTIHNNSLTPMELTVVLTARADLAAVDAIRAGRDGGQVVPTVTQDAVTWSRKESQVLVTPSQPASTIVVVTGDVVWTWLASVPPLGSWTVELTVRQEESGGHSTFLPSPPENAAALLPAEDAGAACDVDRLRQRCLADLRAMLLTHHDSRDSFVAAGSPWYFTLFGRDALWTARFLLPWSVELAAGTLRALATYQGNRYDPDTEEQPGKIPHELRRTAVDIPSPEGGTGLRLPPVYYGTIDATPLWICLLHEVWRAGMSRPEVEDLLPALRAALRWVTGPGDPDRDGLLEYAGSASDGLVNQGWKDSATGIRWDDGRAAEAPVALCEVQGYAYAAALGGAEVLDAFGDNGQQWRRWASELRARFRNAFWVSDSHGHYPAVALDGDKRPVTGPASNMAHLLGTGLLEPDEAALVARQLAKPTMDAGYGLRTLSADTAAFNPLSYHCGSVWPHDTAVAVLGLASEGHHAQARSLAQGLLRAAPACHYRLPELYGGSDFWAGEPVTAYPAACSPQAWSAAGALAVLRYLETSGAEEGSDRQVRAR